MHRTGEMSRAGRLEPCPVAPRGGRAVLGVLVENGQQRPGGQVSPVRAGYLLLPSLLPSFFPSFLPLHYSSLPLRVGSGTGSWLLPARLQVKAWGGGGLQVIRALKCRGWFKKCRFADACLNVPLLCGCSRCCQGVGVFKKLGSQLGVLQSSWS